MPSTFYVDDEDQLNSALAAIDLGGASAAPNTAYSIQLTQSIELTSSLDAIDLANGSSLNIDGGNYVLNGDGDQRGLFDYSGALSVENLTVAGTQALGGSGSGGGAGLGGGLFVASGASVNLANVDFIDDSAVGGAGGTAGGGGGLGGNGGTGGGGIGSGAVGNGTSAFPYYYGVPTGGAGIVLGQPDGGGGGGSYSYSSSGGGIGGTVSTYAGGQGGYGGGGGEGLTNPNYYYYYGEPGSPGGNGGFGGGGGAGSSGYNPYNYYYYYGSNDAGGSGGNGGFGGGAGTGGSGAYDYYYYPYQTVPGAPGTPGFGGGNAQPGSNGGGVGGGGLGAGGAIFVQQGGSLTYSGGSEFDGAVAGGNAGQANAGSAFGSGIFLQGYQSVTFAPQNGLTMTIADVIADQSGSGGVGANAGSGSVYIGNGVSQGHVVLSGTNSYTGGTVIRSGTLELARSGSAGSGAISIATGALLQVDAGALPGNVIEGLASGGALDLRGIPYGVGRVLAIRTGLSTDATLTVYSASASGTITQTNLTLDDAVAPLLSQVTTSDDGHGGTLITEAFGGAAPCFATGTLIATTEGYRPVETLVIGETVVLIDEGCREIVWTGHRRQHGGCVVRVRKDALGPMQPARDLIVSEDHGLYLRGVLVQAGLLVNGDSIVREHREVVTFWHVELRQHGILLAEGAAAESYLDTGNRRQFTNCPMGYDPVMDGASKDLCAEMVFAGERLDAIRNMLAPSPASTSA